MFTKENIFPMYVNSNAKVKYRVDGKDGFQYDNYDQYLGDGSGEHIPQIMMYCGDIVSISDCTLLLKSISKMGQEEKNKWGLLRLHPKVRGYGRVTYDTPESFLWLIQHGYAISDKLFELGIAEEI